MTISVLVYPVMHVIIVILKTILTKNMAALLGETGGGGAGGVTGVDNGGYAG